MAITILIIESDNTHAESLSSFFLSEGFQVEVARSGEAGLKHIRRVEPDFLIVDALLPDGDGFSVLRSLNELKISVPCVMITSYASVESAVRAMKLGTIDYLVKPLDYNNLKQIIRRNVVDKQQNMRRNTLEASRKELNSFDKLIGKSPVFIKAVEQAKIIARSPAGTILLQGESGTGKELFAKAIHYNAGRLNKSFIEINCSAIPEGLLEAELFGHEKGAFTGAVREKLGLFEIANNGTLFLDEIGHMPLALQAKLVKAIEEKTYRRVGGTREMRFDARIISATHRNLKEAVQQGHFRADLYYRLQILFVDLPSLRERGPGDIELIAKHFLAFFAREYDRKAKAFSPEALTLLKNYTWPGNVRQLRNAVERAVIMGDEEYIQAGFLQLDDDRTNKSIDLNSMILPDDHFDLQTFENTVILKTLEKHDGNKSAAAAYLHMSRDTFRYRLEQIQQIDRGK